MSDFRKQIIVNKNNLVLHNLSHTFSKLTPLNFTAMTKQIITYTVKRTQTNIWLYSVVIAKINETCTNFCNAIPINIKNFDLFSSTEDNIDNKMFMVLFT